MAAVFEYLFAHAASSDPATSPDASGNSRTLTMVYDSGGATIGADANGGYFNITAAPNTSLARAYVATTTGSLQAALNGLQKFTIILTLESLQVGDYPDSPVMEIGPSGGIPKLSARVADAGGAGYINFEVLGGKYLFGIDRDSSVALVVDSTQATAADRFKFFIRNAGTNEAGTIATTNTDITLNAALSIDTSDVVCFGNAVDGSNNCDGGFRYAYMDNDALTSTPIYSAFTALASDDDTAIFSASATTSSVPLRTFNPCLVNR